MQEIRQKFPIFIAMAFLGGAFIILNFSSATPQTKLEKDVVKMKDACANRTNKENCYAENLGKLTTETSMVYTFDVLHSLQNTDPAARGCHFIAHSISHAETEKDPSKWRETMNSAPQDCSYGAAHGALEVHASTFPDGELPKSEIPTICNNPDTNNCTHILGHLLLVVNKNNIPESLAECATLPHNAMSKFECYTGVFMERITANNLVTHGLANKSALNWSVRLPEVVELCKNQSDIYSVACWKESAHVAAVVFHNDMQKQANFCETAPTAEAAKQCITHSLGIIGATYAFKLNTMKPMCDITVKDSVMPDFKSDCYGQLVAATLSTIPSAGPDAEKFCNSIEAAYRESCLTMVQNQVSYHTRTTSND